MDELILRLLQHGIWDFLGRIQKQHKIGLVRVGASSGDAMANFGNVADELVESNTLSDGTVLKTSEKNLIRSIYIETQIEEVISNAPWVRSARRAYNRPCIDTARH